MRKRTGNNRGFGLLLLVIVVAVAGLLVTGSAWQLANQASRTQLRIDEAKAHYLAQAGIMRAIRNWYNVSANGEIARTAAPINTTVTGNQIFKVGYEADGSSILESNYAYVVPGISFVKNVGTVTHNAAGTTSLVFTVPASTTVPVGNYVVVEVAMDANGTAPNIGTVANNWLDSKGNTYALLKNCANANAATVVRTVVFSAPITTALTTGDTITVRWTTNTTAKAITVFEFSGVDTYDTNFNGANACANVANGVGGTAPVTGTITPQFARELIVGAIGVEGSAGDAWTAGMNYQTNPPTAIGIGATTNGAKINPEYRVINSITTYTAGGTITSRDWAAVMSGFYPASRWFVSGADRRLRQWQLYNRHASSSITLDKVKISWSPAGGELLNDFVLNGTSVWPGGTAVNGATVDITNTTLNAGLAWSGDTTYIQWNGAVNSGNAVTVTCQFIFSGDSATANDRTQDVVLWNGDQTGANQGMPADRSWIVTATGQVNQTLGENNFKVLKSIKARVSGGPETAAGPAIPQVEITDWEEESKNIP